MSANERRAEIMRIMVARRQENMQVLASELGVSDRTIRNDIVALTAEYPLETYRGNGGGVRQQAPSCAVRPGTFRAAGCSPHRAGAFDAVGDKNPVPGRVRCPRPEGNVPGRAGCPRQRPGMGATRTSDSPHVPVGPGAKGATSRPPAGLGC